MMLKLLSVLLYCLRWLAWAFHYLIIWPAATLMLLVAMLLWMENTTPGEAMAQEIIAVTHNVSSGEFRIAACRDEPLDPFIPPAPQASPPASRCMMLPQLSAITGAASSPMLKDMPVMLTER